MEEKLKEIFNSLEFKKQENCPEESIIVFYVEGRLRKAEKALLEKHLKECNYCLQKVIELKETEYLYSLSKRGLLKNFFTSVKELFTHKKLILAFACIILLFSVLFVSVKQESLPVDPSSIVTVRAVDAAERVKAELRGILIEDGYILTSMYPISGAKKLKIILNDGKTYEVDEILIDRERNIALIKIQALQSTAKPLTVAGSAMVGEEVYLIPSKKGYTVKAIVSDLKPQSTRKTKKEPDFLQIISEKESQGDGIVVDRDGKALAVTSTKEGRIIFAGLLKEAVAELKNKKPVKVETVKEEKNIAEALYYYFKGILAVDSKKNYVAEAYFKKAIELDPKLEGAYLELAGIYYERRLYDLEIEQYRKVLSINPENTDALYFLAQAYETKGWYEEAIKLYRKVLEIEPEDAETIFSLGLAYLTVGEKQKAIELYPKLKNLDPGFAEKLRRLGSDAL
jgi:tetratricopeptide (TPR) repeat protein